jgi:predicted lipoprotein with Yx(FWY)xxD motif
MKRFMLINGLALALLAVVGSLPVRGQEKESPKAKSTTIIGEVVDTRCYIGDDQDQKGAKHKACAEKCAKAGAALAILQEKTNTLYLIMPKEDGENPNTEFIPFIAKNVLVSGKVFEVGGMKAIVPSAVKEKK